MNSDAPSPGAATAGKRERNRLARTRLYVDTALEIVTTEGFDALRMQRLADETDSAIGAVYRYFPSKGALMAEVNREAVERISTSYALACDRHDPHFVDLGLSAADLALTRAVFFARFILATADSLPQELRLLQALIGETRIIIPLEDGLRVLPSVMKLLSAAQRVLDDCVAHGAFRPGDSMDRVVTFAAAISGVLRLSTLDRYDAEMFDGQRLARALTRDLFHAWGAGRDALAAADERVDEVERRGPLAPVPPVH